MNGEVFVLIAIIGALILYLVSRFSRTFDDPKPMSDEHLISAIAGQADWLEKVRRAPIESQMSPAIIDLSKKRRAYIAQLCTELISRPTSGDGQLNTPSLIVFFEIAKYAKELESPEINLEKAAVRAVKNQLFTENGVIYLANWEV